MSKQVTVGKKVLRVAHAAGIGISELAEILGVSRTTPYSYSQRDNANPSQDKVARLAQSIQETHGVRIPLEWFFDGRDTPVPLGEGFSSPSRLIVQEDEGRGYLRAGPKVQMAYFGNIPDEQGWHDPFESAAVIEMDAKFAHARRFVGKIVGDQWHPQLCQGDLTVWHLDTSPQFGTIVLTGGGEAPCNLVELAHDTKDSVLARLIAVIRLTDGLEQTWSLPSGLRFRHLE